MNGHRVQKYTEEARQGEPVYRSIQKATGNGCACRLGDEQIKSFAHRVRMYAHLRGVSHETVLRDIGVGGEGAAQVLAALENE